MSVNTVPVHVQARMEQRDAQLQPLGHASYAAYLRSDEWAEVRRRYRESPSLPQECFCGEMDVQFHHKTYERVGQEHLTDLVPLCANCHQMVHVFERRGEATLEDIAFYDPFQAERWREQTEALRERAEVEAPDRLERSRLERKERNRARRQRRTKKRTAAQQLGLRSD